MIADLRFAICSSASAGVATFGGSSEGAGSVRASTMIGSATAPASVPAVSTTVDAVSSRGASLGSSRGGAAASVCDVACANASLTTCGSCFENKSRPAPPEPERPPRLERCRSRMEILLLSALFLPKPADEKKSKPLTRNARSRIGTAGGHRACIGNLLSPGFTCSGVHSRFVDSFSLRTLHVLRGNFYVPLFVVCEARLRFLKSAFRAPRST